MAVNITLNVQAQKGAYTDQFPCSISRTQATAGGHRPVVTVNSSQYEAVAVGDVATPWLWYGRNLDTSSTEYVSVMMTTAAGSTAGQPFGRLRAGLPFFFPLDASVATKLKWKATSGTIKVDSRILNL